MRSHGVIVAHLVVGWQRRLGASMCRLTDQPPGYADRMTARRITVSVPEQLARRMREAAGGRPVSTWLADVVEEHLDDRELEEKWLAFYEGVSPTPADVRRADAILQRATKQRTTKRRRVG